MRPILKELSLEAYQDVSILNSVAAHLDNLDMKKVKTKSKLEWFKKNIVIVPVVAAIIAGTFTSVRYVLSLTDTITANQQEIVDLTRDLKQAQKNIADQNTRLSSAEATWTMAENLYRQLADTVRDHTYDLKDLTR